MIFTKKRSELMFHEFENIVQPIKIAPLPFRHLHLRSVFQENFVRALRIPLQVFTLGGPIRAVLSEFKDVRTALGPKAKRRKAQKLRVEYVLVNDVLNG